VFIDESGPFVIPTKGATALSVGLLMTRIGSLFQSANDRDKSSSILGIPHRIRSPASFRHKAAALNEFLQSKLHGAQFAFREIHDLAALENCIIE
jgi:hypothetical protein